MDMMVVNSKEGLSVDAFMKRLLATERNDDITYDSSLLLAIAQLVWVNRDAIFLDLTEPHDIVHQIRLRFGEDTPLEVTNVSYCHELVEDHMFPECFMEDKKVPLDKWASAFLLSENCMKFRWIHSANAPEPDPYAMQFFGVWYKFESYLLGEWEEKKDKPSDIVAISRSPRYVPFRYQHLCDIVTMPKYTEWHMPIKKERIDEVKQIMQNNMYSKKKSTEGEENELS